MKIALVCDLIYPYSIGGAESRYFSLGKELVLRGHEVHLFGVKMWPGNRDKKITERYFIHGVSKYKNKYSFDGKRTVFEPIKYSFFLLFALLKYDFDIIDVSNIPFFPAFSCKLYSMIKRKPLMITWHEVWDRYWYEYKGLIIGTFGRIVERLVANISKNNICVSKRTKKRFDKISLRDSTVVDNWIEYEEIKKAKPSQKKYDIISIGRHLEHKNFDILLKVCSILKKNHPKIKMLIIGEGPETEKLLRIRKKLNLENNVEIISFLKEKSDIYSYMKSSKIFVLLSELEGFSIVSFEAMACGLPVVTLNSEKNALKDYVKKNGFVVNKNEIEITDKLNQLLDNKKLRKDQGKKAQKLATRFDIKTKVEQIERYYNKL